MENRILIQLSLNEEEKPMYSWKTRMAKTAAAVLAGALALSGCGGGTGTTNAKGGPSVADTITAQVAYSSRDFNPLSTSMALPMAGNWHVTEALYTLQMSDYSLVSGLAAGEPEKISDTEYVITIRDGAKFSDGNAVAANDVKTSFERVMAPGGVYAPMLSFIDSITAQGDNKIDFKLKYAFTLFKERMSLVHIVPASQSDADLKKMPIGSGPWKYVEITDQQVKFDKNEYYNGEFPAQVSHMVWNVNVDDTARVTAMQNGKSDIMENVPAKAFDTLKAAGADIETVDGFNQAFIMFNTKQKPFDDKRVRQAVFYAIDTESMIKNQLSGEANMVTGFMPESFKAYHKASNVYTYNPEKAKELLKEAGVSEGVKFTLYTTDQTWITQLAPQIKNNLDAIGFNVDIQSMKSSALFPTITDKDDADFSMVLGPGDPTVFGNDPDVLLNWWFGDTVWTKQRMFWNGSDGYNKLHELMDKAARSSGDEQQSYWNECFDLLSDELPMYPLFHRKLSTAVKKNVFSSYTPIGTTGLYFLNSKLNG